MPGFKLDENLPADAARLVRQASHDAISVGEQGLCGTPDDTLARVCRRERRVLVTLDLGFADIRRYPPPSHCGIVILRLGRYDRRMLLAALLRALSELSGQDLAGQLCVVTEAGIRRRT